MSEGNSKRNASTTTGLEWAGTVARIRRGGKSLRAGRRSALLGVMTAAYGNTSTRISPCRAPAPRLDRG